MKLETTSYIQLRLLNDEGESSDEIFNDKEDNDKDREKHDEPQEDEEDDEVMREKIRKRGIFWRLGNYNLWIPVHAGPSRSIRHQLSLSHILLPPSSLNISNLPRSKMNLVAKLSKDQIQFI